ncbi:MAG: hydrolase 2, exosortase A system-associated, partial [Proteobacteria bacterium]|nr:hydrolase 2, exosortase A system-associated [Pseudomonadota bacterium]
MKPFYLDGPSGRLFCLWLGPDKPMCSIIYCPPFAEEMNRCRRMASITAMAMADNGIGVLIPDLYGTGDSEGDFGDSSWEKWIDDIDACTHWIQSNKKSAEVSLWGIRVGALLATEVCRRNQQISSLLFWQPVTSGSTAITQFLRIKLAASFRKIERETPNTLRKKLEAEKKVEVGGYNLNPELIIPIDKLKMENLFPEKKVSVKWFDVSSFDEDLIPPSVKNVIEIWEKTGCQITYKKIHGTTFWATQEMTVCNELKNKTIEAV